MLVLTTEDLDNSWGRLDTYLGRQPGDGVAKPTARANVYRGDAYVPMPEERARVAAVDHFDVGLYDIGRNSSGYGPGARIDSSAAAPIVPADARLRPSLPKLRGPGVGITLR